MPRPRGLPADPKRIADLLPGRVIAARDDDQLSLDAPERDSKLLELAQTLEGKLEATIQVSPALIPRPVVHSVILLTGRDERKWLLRPCRSV